MAQDVITEQNALIIANVDSVGNLGQMVTKSGGQTESDESKTRLGAMGKQISLPVLSTVENVTVTKHFDADMRSKLSALKKAVGKRRMTVTVQAVDIDGNALGEPERFTGLLNRVTPPDVDGNSTDASMIELELSTDSQ